MKTMKYVLGTFFLSIFGLTSVQAQDYLLDYGPGSPYWCYQMNLQNQAMEMQTAMMQQQITEFYRQQAAAATQHMMTNPFVPMQGVYTYDGVYITPETMNNYTHEDVECDNCEGGFNYRTIYTGNGKYSRVRSRCIYCHGSGHVRRTVLKD